MAGEMGRLRIRTIYLQSLSSLGLLLVWYDVFDGGMCYVQLRAKLSAGENGNRCSCLLTPAATLALPISWAQGVNVCVVEPSALWCEDLMHRLLVKEKHHDIASKLIRNTYFFFPSSLIRISHLTLHSLSNLHRLPLSQPPLTRLNHRQYPSLSTFRSHSRAHSHPIRSSCLCLTFPNLPQVSILPCITWDCFRCTTTTTTTKFSSPTLHGLFTGPLFTLHRVTLLILQMFHFLWGLAAATPQITRAV